MISTLETYARNKTFITYTGTTPGNPLVGARDIVSGRKLEVLWAGSTLKMADQFHDGEIRKLQITLQNPLIIEDESRESIYGSKGNARIVDEVLGNVRGGRADWDGIIFLDTVDGMEVADVMAVFPKNASVDHAVQVTGTLTYDSDTGAPTVTHGFYDPEPAVAGAKPSVNVDEEHGQALEETGFWGRAGAGSIVMAKETGRLLLPLRSDEVLEPGTWGTWGGAIDPNEEPQSAARRELQEEAGFTGELELVPLLVFEATDSGGQVTFRYHNFLAIVDREFEPQLNWEAAEFRWVEPAKLPRPLHPGLKALLDDHASVEIIQAERSKAEARTAMAAMERAIDKPADGVFNKALPGVPRWEGSGFRALNYNPPPGISVMDLLEYEGDDLGNDDIRQAGIHTAAAHDLDLEAIPATDAMWVTRTRDQARQYGREHEIHEIDTKGWGMLVDLGSDGALLIRESALQKSLKSHTESSPKPHRARKRHR